MQKNENEFVDLRNYNSLKIPSYCKTLIHLSSVQDLLLFSNLLHDKKFILGEGTNIIIDAPAERPILYPILLNVIKNKTILSSKKNIIYVRCFGGENWNTFVNWTLENNFGGIENLISIPGTVGAAPFQNIGAYGVEISNFISSVNVWDFKKKVIKTLTRKQCKFSYRSSIFKEQVKDDGINNPRYLILSIDFRLWKIDKYPLQIEYSGIKEKLPDKPTAKKLASVIAKLREQKLPNPNSYPNIGSFFINPSISVKKAQLLKKKFPEMPFSVQKENSLIKISAAWLIEKAGFRGKRENNIGVSNRHSLILINYKNASAKKILSFAKEIQDAVMQKFNIQLTIEPTILDSSEI